MDEIEEPMNMNYRESVAWQKGWDKGYEAGMKEPSIKIIDGKVRKGMSTMAIELTKFIKEDKDRMKFKGFRKIHRKMKGRAVCRCGSKMQFVNGEWHCNKTIHIINEYDREEKTE